MPYRAQSHSEIGPTRTRSDDRAPLAPTAVQPHRGDLVDDSRLSKFPLFSVLPDAMTLVDERGIIRNANNHLANLSGFPRDQIEGETVDFLVPMLYRELDPSRRTRD